MLPNDGSFERCKTTIQESEENGKVAIISDLAITETVHAIRKKITGDVPQSEDTGIAENDAISESEMAANRFLRRVSELREQGKVELVESVHTVADHHRRVCSKSYGYTGHVKHTDKKYRYTGLGHADIEHAFLASDAGAHIFCSTDGYFADLAGDRGFSHMSFGILRPPKR